MIARFSAAVAHNRRPLMLVAALVCAVAVTDAVRAPHEPAAALVAMAAFAGLALAAGCVVGVAARSRAAARFVVDPAHRTFHTPPGAAGVFAVVFLLAGLALFAEIGGWSWRHGDRDGGWVVVMTMLAMPVLVFTTFVWRGVGVTISPDGIRTDRETGTVFIPWTAVATDQPSRAEGAPLDLALTDPDQTTRTGLIRRPNRLSFEETRPAFIAAAIAHYAAHPTDRPTIGTEAGHHHLTEVLELPPPESKPAPSRRQIWTRATGGVVTFAAAATLAIWAEGTLGRHSTLGYTVGLISQLLGLAALSTLITAIRGARARSRKPR